MSQLRPVPLPNLSGKVALITGASRGIGRAAAEHFVRAGATVYAGTFSAANAPANTIAIRIDVTSDDEVRAAIARIEKEQGRLDCLVNNAGAIEPIATVDKLDSAEVTKLFDINVVGVLRCMTAALPLIVKSGGTIVNAGSGAAFNPLEGWSAYCASKAAVVMLSRVAALENAGNGTKIFALGIPATDTDMQVTIRASGINRISQIKKEDLPHPDVTASIMAWLCGAEARALEDVAIDVRDPRFAALAA
jgi:NAD(P)-dependent dehydrogenase (short-subunit alcohol dehydrogenase family)